MSRQRGFGAGCGRTALAAPPLPIPLGCARHQSVLLGRSGRRCRLALFVCSFACGLTVASLRRPALHCVQPFIVRLVARRQDVSLPLHRRPLFALPAVVSAHGDAAQTVAGRILHATVAAATHGLPSQTTGGKVSQSSNRRGCSDAPILHSPQLTRSLLTRDCFFFFFFFFRRRIQYVGMFHWLERGEHHCLRLWPELPPRES